jgi:hypothetical protein
MTLETIIDGLSRDEQMIAMELLWKRLTHEAATASPPPAGKTAENPPRA